MKIVTGLMIGFLFMGMLPGCGGSSDSSSPEAKEFALGGYEGSTVSSESITGTWVAVYNRRSDIHYDGRNTQSNETGKVYFIFREKQGGQGAMEASVCSGTFTDVSYSQNQIELNFLSAGMRGQIIGNVMISASNDLADDYFFENESLLESIDASVTYAMVKVSDSTEKLGSYSLTFNDQSMQKDAYCFTQTRFAAGIVGGISGTGESYKIGANGDIESLELSSAIFENETSAEASFNTDGISTLDFASEDGDAINYSVNEESDFSHQITYTISGGGNSINGSLVIELPVN